MPRFISDSRWAGWDAEKGALKRAQSRCMALATVNVALSLLCGVIPTGVTRYRWVGFSATIALLLAAVEWIAAWRFRRAGETLEKRRFEGIHRLMCAVPQCHMLMMAVAIAAGVISCVTAFTGAADVLVLAGFGLCFACSLLIWQTYRRIKTHDISAAE